MLKAPFRSNAMRDFLAAALRASICIQQRGGFLVAAVAERPRQLVHQSKLASPVRVPSRFSA
jgi:hypothetical protein